VITYTSSDESIEFEENCLTTGYPFLQVGFFDTSLSSNDHERVLIVLNEADDMAKFAVKSGGESNYFHAESAATADEETILKSSIPPHSIQTYLF